MCPLQASSLWMALSGDLGQSPDGQQDIRIIIHVMRGPAWTHSCGNRRALAEEKMILILQMAGLADKDPCCPR